MARIVGGSPMGELRGKMGGFVFSRNSSGAYVRSYVVPVDPNTIAQQRARSTFASAAGSWHSLDDATKSLWNSFAKTHFNPQRGANTGQFSGMNAYTALNNGFLQMATFSGATNVTANGIPPLLAKSEVALSAPILPPTETLVNQIATNGVMAPGEVATMELGSVQISENFEWKIEIKLSEEITINDTVDSKGNKFGFSVFVSEALDQPNMFVQNPYLQLLKVTKAFELDAPLSDTNKFWLQNLGSIPAEDYRTRPSVGQFVRATVMAIGVDGQFAKIGAKVVEISS